MRVYGMERKVVLSIRNDLFLALEQRQILKVTKFFYECFLATQKNFYISWKHCIIP